MFTMDNNEVVEVKVPQEPEIIVEPEPEYATAGMFQRMVAFVIDSLLAVIIGWVIRMPVGIMNMLNLMDSKKEILFNYNINQIISYVAVVTYFILFTILLSATPGKMLMHIKVVSMDKENRVWDIIFRETVGRFLSSILLIGYIVGFFDKKRRCLHDRLGDTRVVANVK